MWLWAFDNRQILHNMRYIINRHLKPAQDCTNHKYEQAPGNTKLMLCMPFPATCSSCQPEKRSHYCTHNTGCLAACFPALFGFGVCKGQVFMQWILCRPTLH
jgi:hypothetical protein